MGEKNQKLQQSETKAGLQQTSTLGKLANRVDAPFFATALVLINWVFI